jgi:hypothetical protein
LLNGFSQNNYFRLLLQIQPENPVSQLTPPLQTCEMQKRIKSMNNGKFWEMSAPLFEMVQTEDIRTIKI